jgi:sec-independent protein translocase protein TatB
MFDVGLSELMVIGVVALIVIGPERLPRVARTVGHLLGRLQRYVNTVKSDINREMHLEDLKRFEQRMSTELSSIETSVAKEMQTIETEIRPVDTPAPIATPAHVDTPTNAVSPALTSHESLVSEAAVSVTPALTEPPLSSATSLAGKS